MITPEETIKNWFVSDPGITTFFTKVYLNWFFDEKANVPLTPFICVHRLATGNWYTLDGVNQYQDCHIRVHIFADTGEDCSTGRFLVNLSMDTLNSGLTGNKFMPTGEEWVKSKISGVESAGPHIQLDYQFWTVPV